LYGTTTSTAQSASLLVWDADNERLGVATSSPLYTLDVRGTIAGERMRAIGATPSIAEGSCAGTGGDASIDGTDMAGEITLTTGSSPVGGASCFTVTFAEAYGTAPRVLFSAANNGAGLLTGLAPVYAETTTSTFNFKASVGLLGSTEYRWNYYIIETD
jgi:hypothetical protein